MHAVVARSVTLLVALDLTLSSLRARTQGPSRRPPPATISKRPYSTLLPLRCPFTPLHPPRPSQHATEPTTRSGFDQLSFSTLLAARTAMSRPAAAALPPSRNPFASVSAGSLRREKEAELTRARVSSPTGLAVEQQLELAEHLKNAKSRLLYRYNSTKQLEPIAGRTEVSSLVASPGSRKCCRTQREGGCEQGGH